MADPKKRLHDGKPIKDATHERLEGDVKEKIPTLLGNGMDDQIIQRWHLPHLIAKAFWFVFKFVQYKSQKTRNQ